MEFWTWIAIIFIGSAFSQTIYHSLFTKPGKIELKVRKFKKDGKILTDSGILKNGSRCINPFCEEFLSLATFGFETLDCSVMLYDLFIL